MAVDMVLPMFNKNEMTKTSEPEGVKKEDMETKVPMLENEKFAAASWVIGIPDSLDPPPYSEKDPLRDLEEAEEETGSVGSSITRSPSECWDSDDDDDSPVSASASSLPWSELSTCGRVRKVLVNYLGKFVALVALLYIFICSLDFLSSAFRILGGKTAGGVFTNSELLNNPISGLMIGILATVLVQSSSTSTSIVVTMVASGILEVRPAIPIIMGANIGTSVTNTFVSMAQSGDRREFRRAFAGATVHDMFNWLTVLILLPLEAATGYLYWLTSQIVKSCNLESYKGGKQELLKALTKPFTKLVVQVDKKVINKIAEGHEEYLNKSLIKRYCKFEETTELRISTVLKNMSFVNVDGSTEYMLTNMTEEHNVTEKHGTELCFSLFSQLDLNDNVSGVILLIASLAILCSCLIGLVKLLNSMLQGSIAKTLKKTLNSDFPGYFSFLTGYVAILVGAIMTVLVQSSSVFTSTLTPLVGVGMLKLERMYPLTLGSNIGTTGTGLLAAMAASGDKLEVALQISLCHLFFNISGILMFYPIPRLRKIPIKFAKFLGTTTAKYRWFAVLYLILMFLFLPLSVFSLSMAGIIPSIVVGSIVGLVVLFIIVLNILQRKCPKILPSKMKTWEFLPLPLRSLSPYDRVVMKVISVFQRCCPNCCKVKQKKPRTNRIVREIIKPIVINSSPNSSQNSSANSSAAASAASSALLLPFHVPRVSAV